MSFLSKSDAKRNSGPADDNGLHSEKAIQDIDWLQLALTNKWKIALGMLVGLVLGQLAYMKLGPSYVARAKILVSKKESIQLKDTAGKTFGDRAEHIALIMSPMIINKAIEKHELRTLPTLTNSDDPAQDIIDNLQVRRSAGHDRSFLNVLELTYTSPRVDDAKKIVAAIVDAYRDYLSETRQEHSEELIALISEANEELHQKLKEKEAEYLKFRSEAPLHWKNAPGEDGKTGDVTNVHQERVVAIEEERRKNLVLRTELNAKLKAIRKSIDENEPQHLLEAKIRHFMATDSRRGQSLGTLENQREDALDSQLIPLLMEEKRLLRDFGEDHPDVISVRQSIATLQSYYQLRGIQLPKDAPGAEEVDMITAYVQSLEQQLAQLDIRDAELNVLFDKEAQLAKDFTRYHAQDKSLNDEISRIKGLWQVVVNRLNELNLVKESNGYAMKQIAPVRGELVFKRHLKFLGAGAIFGALVMFGLAYLREWGDTTIRSIEEVRSRFGLPILGAIPALDDVAELQTSPQSPLDPSICFAHRPGSTEAEAYRSVRTALYLNSQSTDAKVIQVSSPEPGDGKSTFSANMAVGLAQLGKKVLLIDADLRRPTTHRLLAVDPKIGLSDVLEGEIELLNAVQSTSVSNLSILTSGVLPTNPAEQLSSSAFRNVMETARKEFDFVIVDTPPILVVSDPCIVAPHVDGMLLMLRLYKNRRATVARTIELIDSHSVNLIGTVTNGFDDSSDDQYRRSEEYSGYYETDRSADYFSDQELTSESVSIHS